MIGTKGLPAKWGGIEKYVEEVGKRLVQRGHEVTVFGARWYNGSLNNGTYLGINVRSVPTLHLQATDALCNAILSSILVMKGKYDIVHFHGHSSYCVMPFVKKAGKIAVITVHQIESAWDNPKYNSLGQKVIERMFIKGLTVADRVTTVANYLETQIKGQFGRASVVIPSGVDVDIAQAPEIVRGKYGLHGDDYVLFLGRIDPIKRIEWMLDLVPLLREKNIKVVIAGAAQDSATSAYLNRLQSFCSDKGRCIFPGMVQGREKIELLSNCLSFIMPSSKEGLPITLLEAMSFGKCCLASDIPAHREVIKNNVSGLLFNSEDKTDYLDKFNHLMGFPKKDLAKMGKVGEEYVKANYDWNRTVDCLEKVYIEAFNSKR